MVATNKFFMENWLLILWGSSTSWLIIFMTLSLTQKTTTIGVKLKSKPEKNSLIILKSSRKKLLRPWNWWNPAKNTSKLDPKNTTNLCQWVKPKESRNLKRNLICGSNRSNLSSILKSNQEMRVWSQDQRLSWSSGEKECKLSPIGLNNSKAKISTSDHFSLNSPFPHGFLTWTTLRFSPPKSSKIAFKNV